MVGMAEDVRGVVTPAKQALISAEMRGRIIAMPFREGETFQKGSLLISFDCTGVRAELRASQAERRIRELNYQSAQRLFKLNATGALDADVTKAEFDKADSLSDVRQAAVDHCEVSAPFEGVMGETLVNVEEVVTFNQELFRIVGTQSKEIELIVPSNWVRRLKLSTRFEFTVSETGTGYSALITRIAPQIDTLSQTVKIFAEIESAGAEVLPGMSGFAEFDFDSDG